MKQEFENKSTFKNNKSRSKSFESGSVIKRNSTVGRKTVNMTKQEDSNENEEEQEIKSSNFAIKTNNNNMSKSKPNIFISQNINANENLPNIQNNNSMVNMSGLIQGVNNNNNNNNKNKKKQLTDKEIEKKVEEFKRKLNLDLLKVLSEEKFKEEERELLYNKTTNPVERKRLEKIIAMERTQSSERIMKINE